jgi:predicted secreted protein with PEFG-CTERM motif
MKLYFVLSIVFASLFFTTMIAFSQSQLIFVETSKNVYEEGDTIVIHGNVTTIIVGEEVSMTIIHEGTIVDIAQIGVAQDGKFTTTFQASGPLWTKDGAYTIRTFYGKTIMETSFEFFTKEALIETTDIFDVDAGSYGTFDVPFTIRGATVENMLVDSDIFGLIVIIDSEDDGKIILDLPRQSIDAKKSDNTDDTFIILIDAIEVPYEEISNDAQNRRISIDFEEGDSDIEIIGTFVVPEFGNVVMLVLTVSIISIIILSSKFRIIGLKKY